jgi:DNA-binding transcriptional regulator YiaG
VNSIDRLVRTAKRRRDLPSPERRREIRETACVSGRELAEVLKCAPETVWRWENDKREPSGDLRLRYIELLARLENEVCE